MIAAIALLLLPQHAILAVAGLSAPPLERPEPIHAGAAGTGRPRESAAPAPPDWESQVWRWTADRVAELLEMPGGALPSQPALNAPPAPHRPSQSAAELLEDMARAEDPEIRARARDLAPQAPEDIRLLLAGLAGAPPEQRAARRALEHIQEEDLVARVLDMAGQGPETDRQLLYDALPELLPRLETPLLDALRHVPDPESNRALVIAYCLGRMGSHAATPILEQRLQGAAAPATYAYANALYLARDPRALPKWRELAAHADPQVRGLAYAALARHGAESEVALLAAAARGESEQDHALQLRAIDALAGMHGDFLVPLLIEILEANPRARTHAAAALQQRTGMQLGASPAAWRDWLKALNAPPPLLPAEPR